MSESNEYTPWVEQGITELEYFKKAFLDAGTWVEELEKDKARLDWMEDRHYVEATNTEAPGGHERPGVTWIRHRAENSLRNAIDDAMVTDG